MSLGVIMSTSAFNWQCPFCNHKQTVIHQNLDRRITQLQVGQTTNGYMGLWNEAIRCVNPECNKLSLEVSVDQVDWSGSGGNLRSIGEQQRWRLLPQSLARPWPDYIPQALRDDYNEACLIRDLSPKASATLARRTLQGMLHDFCGIQEKTLYAEIAKLEKQVEEGTAPRGVEAETIAAIHAVRKIGNIGAHMESDINLIVDVDPNEAQALIELIELLFEDWYVAREERKKRLARILEIDGVKQAARTGVLNSSPQAIAAPSPEK